jgi:isoquinoline 1-oxidoreductase beta subunit
VQGGVVDGISEMLQEIEIRGGAAVQGNYGVAGSGVPLLRMNQTPPAIEVHWVMSDNDPTGLGEPSLPPIVPAVANAIFAASGERIRTMPISKAGFSFA